MAYLVGWNLPGCLPDSVSVYPTREDAVAGMIFDLNVAWDSAYDQVKSAPIGDDSKASILAIVDGDFLSATEAFALSSGDVSHTLGTMIYWVQACECDDATGVTCDTCDEHDRCVTAPF